MMAWEQRAVERRRGDPAPVEGRGQRDLFRHLFGGLAGTGRADGVAQPASDDWLTDAFTLGPRTTVDAITGAAAR
jgi:hypothetical protein